MDREIVKGFIKSFIGYSIVISFTGFLIWWLWTNPIYNPAGPMVKYPVSSVEVKFTNTTVKGRKNGVPYWTVVSKIVESERNSPVIYFKNSPHGEFYNLKDWAKSGSLSNSNNPNNTSVSNERLRTFVWDGEFAEYNTETEDLILKNNIKIVTDDKDIITTHELHWSGSEEKVRSPKRTKILSHKGYPVVSADTLEGDAKMDILHLKGNVDIETELSEEQQL